MSSDISVNHHLGTSVPGTFPTFATIGKSHKFQRWKGHRWWWWYQAGSSGSQTLFVEHVAAPGQWESYQDLSSLAHGNLLSTTSSEAFGDSLSKTVAARYFRDKAADRLADGLR